MKKFLLLVLIALFMGTTAAIAANTATTPSRLATTTATTLSAVADTATGIAVPKAQMGIIAGYIHHGLPASTGATLVATLKFDTAKTVADVAQSSCMTCHASTSTASSIAGIGGEVAIARMDFRALAQERRGIGLFMAATKGDLCIG